MNTRLTLVRHGHTEWNSLGRYQGHAPTPLSEIGRAQAAYLAAALVKAAPIAALYSSDLLRCRQTAGPIAAALGLDVRRDPRFREINYGTWQGLTRGEVAELDPENYAAYMADPMNVSIPGGESQRMLAARVLAGLGDILAAHAGEHVCIVTHGGPIREILRRFDLWGGGMPAGNASLTELRVVSETGMAELLCLMDTSHLPPNLRPDGQGTCFISQE